MNRVRDRLLARLEESVEKEHRTVDFEARWRRRGGLSRAERLEMRYPLLSQVVVVGVLAAGVVGVDLLVLPLVGLGTPFPLALPIVPLAVWLVPRNWALQRRLAKRYEAWRKCQHAEPGEAGQPEA